MQVKTMPLSKWKMQLAFGSAILTLLVTVWLSYRGYVLSLEGDRWSEHTHEVLEKIDDFLLAVRTNESTTRAFLLTGDGSYLDLHGTNILLAQQALASMGALTADNPKQQRQIPVVQALLAARVQRWELVIGIRKSQGLAAAAAAASLGVGRRNTSGLQAAVDKMKDEELRLLVLRDTGTKSRLRQSRNWTIFGTALGLLIICAAGWSALRESSARGLAERALLEREARFRDMANNISQLAWMADKNGSIYWYNQRWFDYTGTTLEEMAGWGWKKVHHPDYVQAVVEKMSGCFLQGEVWEYTFPLRGRDGGYRWFLSRAVPIRDACGAVSHWFGTNTDISELRESENHLAQMEARYRGLLEAAPDAMVVVNQGGAIVLLNVQAEKRFGYSRDELVGQKVTNIIPEGFAERLIADGTRTTAEALAQQIGTGIELKGRCKDGGEFPIEIMLSPLESAEGILVTAAIRDISVRRAAEKNLAQMEGRYRGLLEAAPDAMVVVNQLG
jgi:PAS domain S-box-containing protein